MRVNSLCDKQYGHNSASYCFRISCNEIEISIPDKQIDIQEGESQQSKLDIGNTVIDESISSDSQEKNNNKEGDLIFLFDVPVNIIGSDNTNLDDLLNNPNLSTQENERIKKSIIDILLYVYGFEVDYDALLLTIDENDNYGWFESRPSAYEERWTMVDELCHLKDAHVERAERIKLYSIDANFTVKPYNTIEETQLSIYVPIYDDLESYGDEGGSRKVYCFEFKKFYGAYKIIGISVDP